MNTMSLTKAIHNTISNVKFQTKMLKKKKTETETITSFLPSKHTF